MRNICTLLIVLTFAATSALAQESPDASQQQMPQTQQPSQQQQPPSAPGQTGMTTQAAQTQIQTEFQKESALSGVTVNVTESKVELSGTVASKAEKDKARSIAESNAGGRKVVNNIKVSGSEGKPPSTPY